MFTIKLYSQSGFRQRIFEAQSFTILRNEDGGAEITIHQKNGADDKRYDVEEDCPRPVGYPEVFQRATIENMAGKTTEVISISPRPTVAKEG